MLPTRTRAGFTLVECAVTLVIVAVVAVIIAQLMVWSLRHRAQIATRQAATELAANVLETARAQPFDKLDKTWADAQTVPSDMADLLPAGKLDIQVSPVNDKNAPRSTRVTVEVHWQFAPETPGQSVQLSSVFSPRSTKKEGMP